MPALLLALACTPGEAGDPCLPDVEYSADFQPFSLSEVYLESRSMQCASRLCLVNHFQGRVSCPMGQSGPESDSPCPLPGSEAETERVQGSVPAWDLDRPPSRAVYCSCRCDGADANARYCECPSGFECTKLALAVSERDRELAGSYCVKRGTAFTPSELGGPTCADAPLDARCSE